MNDLEKKEIWNLITSRGDFLKGKLKDDPRHPVGRNSYAHICSLIISKFGCSYKKVNSNKVLELKRFISETHLRNFAILIGAFRIIKGCKF